MKFKFIQDFPTKTLLKHKYIELKEVSLHDKNAINSKFFLDNKGLFVPYVGTLRSCTKFGMLTFHSRRPQFLVTSSAARLLIFQLPHSS